MEQHLNESGSTEQNNASPGPELRVLALTTHPVESPAARYRVFQMVEPLARHGVQVEVQSFTRPEDYGIIFEGGHAGRKVKWLLEGTLRRSLTLARARRFDAILIQVWVHPMTFPPFDLALRLLDVPIVYDIDDAYFLSTGRALDRLRDPGWLPRLMKASHSVVAGSEFIGDFCARFNSRVSVVPTAIDTDRFSPRAPDARARPVVGWIGTHSTFKFVESLFPVFEDLARDHAFTLRLVGNHAPASIPGVDVENVRWRLENESDYFRDLDIGLYPLFPDSYAQAKHGFKLHQYMAVGIPAVVSDYGINAELVENGRNALIAKDLNDWRRALSRLIREPDLRQQMGRAARADLDASLSTRRTAARLAEILREAAASRG